MTPDEMKGYKAAMKFVRRWLTSRGETDRDLDTRDELMQDMREALRLELGV